MRRRRTTGLLAGLGLFVAAFAAGAAGLRGFGPGSLRDIQSAHAGEPFLLVLWSITCGPCREEFEMLAALRAERGPFPLVLVSTDELSDLPLATEMLQRYGLAEVESWIFADPDAQRLRFEIDPSWYGEMPRSYFYDAAHGREGISGGLKRERVEAWLEAGPASSTR